MEKFKEVFLPLHSQQGPEAKARSAGILADTEPAPFSGIETDLSEQMLGTSGRGFQHLLKSVWPSAPNGHEQTPEASQACGVAIWVRGGCLGQKDQLRHLCPGG